jgi:hypothetical protein
MLVVTSILIFEGVVLDMIECSNLIWSLLVWWIVPFVVLDLEC